MIIEAIKCNQKLIISNYKFPCRGNKNVLRNQKAIQCDTCNLWCHIKCDDTSTEIYNNLMLSEDTDTWHCLLCKVKCHHSIFPFILCDNIEIQNLNNNNSMKFCESLPKFEVVTFFTLMV